MRLIRLENEKTHTVLVRKGLFFQYLKEKYHADLDQHLTVEQKAISKSFQWLCEKSIVDIVVYFRWCDPENWPKFREVVFKGAPWLIKATVANGMASSIRKTLYKHGIGRFSDAEKLKILNEAWINTSCIYIGGNLTTLGQKNQPFNSSQHPHYTILSLHSINYNFIYTRYKINYDF